MLGKIKIIGYTNALISYEIWWNAKKILIIITIEKKNGVIYGITTR